MSTMSSGNSNSGKDTIRRATNVIVVGSVMFTFISFWKTAAVVLCDLASTAYYIGGIVEQSIGPAAPWFILSVMVFSYAVRNVYIESCSMYVRGGVYRVVREAMGSFMGKLSVSALIFDYILTGPISSVSAGQYLFGLLLELMRFAGLPVVDTEFADLIKQWGAVAFAMLVTLYFFWQNLKGIHESSDKAFKIMVATTLMAVIVVSWCGVTLAVQGRAPESKADHTRLFEMSPEERSAVPRNQVPLTPTFTPKANPVSGEEVDPLGFISHTQLGERLRSGTFNWLSVVGVLGVLIAFGHSILAMSGEETLAQVYREVEAPKLQNFRKAGFVVFVYSLGLTSLISFLAVLLIPNDVRMSQYADNLIGGLSMHVVGPTWARLMLNAFVVVIGALILSGAVNTAIIGSNGVLNRVAEDGVLPDWLRKPHPKYGTSYRILYAILFFKLFTILASRGDVLLLGEAYAFGVVWSFVFMASSMVILRFKNPAPRQYRMPLNLRLGSIELPLGLIFVFLVLFGAAVMNLLTKNIATIAGVTFTLGFLALFTVSERWRRHKAISASGADVHEHIEQFTVETREGTALSRETLRLPPKPYVKLIAIRSPQNLYMLEKSLAETDPSTTNLVVMTAKILPQGDTANAPALDRYEQELMTAVVMKAEKAGKEVKPLIIPTNNPLHAVLKTAFDLQAQEVVMGASNKYATDMQLEEIQFDWLVVSGDPTPPLSVRVLGRDRDVYLDIAGGNRIPKLSERQARSVDELRAAGVGVNRVLLVHDGTRRGSDLFEDVLTMLESQIIFDVTYAGALSPTIQRDLERAANLGRPVRATPLHGSIDRRLEENDAGDAYDLLIVPLPDPQSDGAVNEQIERLQMRARCPIFHVRMPDIPRDASRE